MSARKTAATELLAPRPTQCLELPADAVRVRKNGIEFRSATPFASWTEMTMTLQTAGEGGRVHCTGVVISCTGSKHAGYHVSMVFTSLSKHAQARLSILAYAQLR